MTIKKNMAFICGCMSLVLLIISVSSSYWLEGEDYRKGLWKECLKHSDDEVGGSNFMECRRNSAKGWVITCATLVILTILCVIIGVFLNGIGIMMKKYKKKTRFYKIAMYMYFFALPCLVVSLIVFPAMFMEELSESCGKDSQWYFGWSYGVAWGAAIFLLGSAILLLVDKESELSFYVEQEIKTSNTKLISRL